MIHRLVDCSMTNRDDSNNQNKLISKSFLMLINYTVDADRVCFKGLPPLDERQCQASTLVYFSVYGLKCLKTLRAQLVKDTINLNSGATIGVIKCEQKMNLIWF